MPQSRGKREGRNMQEKRYTLAFDVEGTLLNRDGKLDPDVVEIFKKADKSKTNFVFLTGSKYSVARAAVEQINNELEGFKGLESYIAANGGSEIYAPNGLRVVDKSLPLDMTAKIIGIARAIDPDSIMIYATSEGNYIEKPYTALSSLAEKFGEKGRTATATQKEITVDVENYTKVYTDSNEYKIEALPKGEELKALPAGEKVENAKTGNDVDRDVIEVDEVGSFENEDEIYVSEAPAEKLQVSNFDAQEIEKGSEENANTESQVKTAILHATPTSKLSAKERNSVYVQMAVNALMRKEQKKGIASMNLIEIEGTNTGRTLEDIVSEIGEIKEIFVTSVNDAKRNLIQKKVAELVGDDYHVNAGKKHVAIPAQSKLEALQQILEIDQTRLNPKLPKKIDEVIFFGDGENDAECLAACNLSVARGEKVSAKAKAAAKFKIKNLSNFADSLYSGEYDEIIFGAPKEKGVIKLTPELEGQRRAKEIKKAEQTAEMKDEFAEIMARMTRKTKDEVNEKKEQFADEKAFNIELDEIEKE